MFAALAAFAAPAQAADPAAAITRLFTEPVSTDQFTPAFLAQVPAPAIAKIIGDLTAAFGAYQGITPAADKFLVHLKTADVPTLIALTDTGLISGLFFQSPIPTAGGVADQVAAIAALPGRTSVLVTKNGATLAEHDSATPLAVGSAAKLAILKALDDAIASGKLTPETIVKLDGRSLPSGMLQDWPAGTPLTIATLTDMMISISDNTATDTLIGTLGRAAVEAVTPANTPFPMTSDMFKLKAKQNAALTEGWRKGTADERRALLDRLADVPLPAVADLTGTATADIEWFMPATALCALLAATHADDAFRINPGLADPADWASVAFKGGSDAGVLNFSTYLVDRAGDAYCVIATWNNDADLDQAALVAPYRGILHALGAATAPK